MDKFGDFDVTLEPQGGPVSGPKFDFKLPDTIETQRESGFLATAASLPRRAVLGAELGPVGFRQMLSDQDKAHLEQLSQDMFNMSAEDWLKARPDHWLSQQYLQAKNDATKFRDIVGGVRMELEAARPPGEGFWGGVVGGAAESLAPSLAGLALAPVSPGAAMVVAGGGGMVSQAGASYVEAKEAGVPTEVASALATRAGVMEGVFEAVPFGAAAKYGKTALQKSLIFAGAEYPTEFLTQIGQSADVKFTYRPEMSWKDILWDAHSAGMSGALMGLLFAPATAHLGRPPKLTAEQEKYRKEAEPLVESLLAAKQLAAMGQPIDLAAEQERFKTGMANIEQRMLTELIEKASVPAPTVEGVSDQKIETLLKGIANNAETPENPESVQKLGNIGAVYEKIKEISQAKLEQEVGDDPDVGRSLKAQGGLSAALNDNDLTPTDQLPISISPNPEDIGKSLKQAQLGPGVYVVGVPNRFLAEDPLQAIYDTVESMRARFMPDNTLIIANQTVPHLSATGAHVMLSPGTHLIIPRDLRGLGTERDTLRFNPQTQMEMYSSLTHEVGHALLYTLRQSLFPAEAQTAMQGEYETLKGKVLSGEMTAKGFIDQWLGPWKVARGLLPTQKVRGKAAQTWDELGPKYAKERYRMLEKGYFYKDDPGSLPQESAIDFLRRWHAGIKGPGTFEEFRDSILSFDEYFGEQTARYEFAGKKYEGVGLGVYFKAVLDRLREFFRVAKAEGRIEPGVAFREFLDNLTAAGGARLSRDTPKAKLGSTKAVSAEDVLPPTPAEVQDTQESPPVAVPIPDMEPTDPAFAETKKQYLRALLDLKLPKGSQLAKDIRNAIINGQFSRASELINEGATGLQYDIGDQPGDADVMAFMAEQNVTLSSTSGLTEAEAKQPSIVQKARQAWHTMHTKSPFFRRWFGDWTMAGRRDEVVSLLVYDPVDRVYVLSNDKWGNRKVPVTASHVSRVDTGEPIRVYHGSRNQNKLFFNPATRGASTKTGAATLGFFTAASPRTARFFRDLNRFKDLTIDAQNVLSHVENAALEVELARAEKLRELGKTINARKNLPESATGKQWQRLTDRIETLREEYNLAHAAVLQNFDAQTAIYENPESYLTGAVPPGRIYPLYANLRNPLHIDGRYTTWADQSMEPIMREAIAQGNDGIIVYNIKDGGPDFTTIVVAFNPSAYKLADGTNATFADTDRIDWDLSDGPEANGETLSRKMKSAFSDKRLGRDLWYSIRSQRYNFLQLQQLAHLNPDFEGLQYFNQQVMQYVLRKQGLMAPGERAMTSWQFRNAKRTNNLEKAISAEVDGGVHWTELTQTGPFDYVHNFKKDGSTFTELKKFGIDVATEVGKEDAELYISIKNALLRQLSETEKILASRITQRYLSGGVKAGPQQAAEIAALVSRVDKFRNTPFFPKQRFGKFLWQVKDKVNLGKDSAGKDIIRWKVIHREAFESESEWTARGKELKPKLVGEQRIEPTVLHDKAVPLMQLPMDFAELAAAELGLTQQETDTLMQIMVPVKQDKAFRAYEAEYRAITGASKDMLRSFASFFWHNSNTLAKMEFKGRIQFALRAMRGELREAQVAAGTGDPESTRYYRKIDELYQFSEGVRDYLLNPADEYYRARGLVSIVFLWGNIKTAVLNLWGLVTTFSDLSTSMGPVKGSGTFLKAIYDNVKALNGAGLTPEEKVAFQKAQDEGVIEQSYAFYLATQATAGNYARAFQRSTLGRYGTIAKHGVLIAGMWPFRAAELAARRVTWLAKFRQAKAQPGTSTKQAYDAAATGTNLLQNDYSLGARPPFMRGKTSLLFIFMSFTQHMAFHAFGGYEKGLRASAALEGRSPRSWFMGYTMKIWLITMLVAGLEGLPGFENILDILDIIWRKLTGRTIRMDLRKAYRDITGKDPSFLLHGIGSEVAGFDVSRSIGFGRIIPGTDVLAQEGDLTKDTAGLVFAIAGPAGALTKYGLGVLYNDGKPWTSPERWSQGLPGGVGNVLRAVQWSMHGVRGPNGALLTKDQETRLLRDLSGWELGGAALGFQPSIIGKERTKRFELKDEINYWASERKQLLDQLWYSRYTQDRELEEDVRSQIKEFNGSVPHSQMRITGDTIRQSLKRHKGAVRSEEQGRPPQKMYRGLARDVEGSY